MEPIKLVFIDDEMEFVKALSDFFRVRGCHVAVALRAGSGLNLIREQQPDVVLMDLKMPGMDGDEALALIPELSPRTKVIIITAYDHAATRDRLLALGAFAHFDKPLASVRQLADTVERAAGRGLKEGPVDG